MKLLHLYGSNISFSLNLTSIHALHRRTFGMFKFQEKSFRIFCFCHIHYQKQLQFICRALKCQLLWWPTVMEKLINSVVAASQPLPFNQIWPLIKSLRRKRKFWCDIGIKCTDFFGGINTHLNQWMWLEPCWICLQKLHF